jgi:hypothetical protein
MVKIIYILGIMHAYKCLDDSASARTRTDTRVRTPCAALHFPYAPALHACLAFRAHVGPKPSGRYPRRAGTARAPLTSHTHLLLNPDATLAMYV